MASWVDMVPQVGLCNFGGENYLPFTYLDFIRQQFWGPYNLDYGQQFALLDENTINVRPTQALGGYIKMPAWSGDFGWTDLEIVHHSRLKLTITLASWYQPLKTSSRPFIS